jgi:hypothetical protein
MFYKLGFQDVLLVDQQVLKGGRCHNRDAVKMRKVGYVVYVI